MIIEESGMAFGDFKEDHLFYIEKSNQYQNINDKAVSSVEFVLYREYGNKLMFIEAKKSAPNPESSHENFEKFVNEISKKFIDSFLLYERVILDKSLTKKFENIDYNGCDILCILVINGFNKEWLSPIKDAIERELRIRTVLLKMWDINVLVINEEQAYRWGLIYRGDKSEQFENI